MDPLYDDFEIIYSPKIEPETDTDSEDKDSPNPTPAKKQKIMKWSHEETISLIDTLWKDCPELWDVKNTKYKDRTAKVTKKEYLAYKFNTTTEEINRKIHNLRTQLHAELRKIKKRRKDNTAVEEEPRSKWEYFDNLTFLLQSGNGEDPEEAGESSSSIVQEQKSEPEPGPSQVSAEAAAKAEREKKKMQTPLSKMLAALSSLANALPLPPPEIPAEPRRILPIVPVIRDESQIFGDFVASELRLLSSKEARNKLKRVIMTSILHATREDHGLSEEDDSQPDSPSQSEAVPSTSSLPEPVSYRQSKNDGPLRRNRSKSASLRQSDVGSSQQIQNDEYSDPRQRAVAFNLSRIEEASDNSNQEVTSDYSQREVSSQNSQTQISSPSQEESQATSSRQNQLRSA